MKILAAQYGIELFGRERENIECYKSFKRLGHEVQVFGSYRAEHGGQTGLLLTQLGLKCGELPFGSHFSLEYFKRMKGYWWLQIKRVYWCSTLMCKKAREMDADAIFLGGTMEFLYLWPWLLMQRRPVIYRVGDAPIWASPFHKSVMKILLSKASLVVPTSHFIHSECIALLNSTKTKAHVIWNIPPEFEAKTDPTDELIYRQATTTGPTKFLFVGQITPEKGVKTMVEALIALKGNSSWQCRIVGGGTYTTEFQKELADLVKKRNLEEKIQFTGQVSNPTEHYNWADWHVLPSHLNEAFGLVIVEAKKQGTPSIVFPLGAMPELIDPDVNGIITKCASVEALTEAFYKAIAAKQCMSGPARDSYEKDFTSARFDSDWETSLNSLHVNSK